MPELVEVLVLCLTRVHEILVVPALVAARALCLTRVAVIDVVPADVPEKVLVTPPPLTTGT